MYSSLPLVDKSNSSKDWDRVLTRMCTRLKKAPEGGWIWNRENIANPTDDTHCLYISTSHTSIFFCRDRSFTVCRYNVSTISIFYISYKS